MLNSMGREDFVYEILTSMKLQTLSQQHFHDNLKTTLS